MCFKVSPSKCVLFKGARIELIIDLRVTSCGSENEMKLKSV